MNRTILSKPGNHDSNFVYTTFESLQKKGVDDIFILHNFNVEGEFDGDHWNVCELLRHLLDLERVRDPTPVAVVDELDGDVRLGVALDDGSEPSVLTILGSDLETDTWLKHRRSFVTFGLKLGEHLAVVLN